MQLYSLESKAGIDDDWAYSYGILEETVLMEAKQTESLDRRTDEDYLRRINKKWLTSGNLEDKIESNRRSAIV
jgi:hypothetical protein